MQEVIWSSWHFENAHAHPQWRKAHTCSECKKSFGQVGHLKGHMITHSKERAYACVQCQKSFGRATYLKRHMLTHSAQWSRCQLGCSCSQNLPGSNYRRIICSCTNYPKYMENFDHRSILVDSGSIVHYTAIPM